MKQPSSYFYINIVLILLLCVVSGIAFFLLQTKAVKPQKTSPTASPTLLQPTPTVPVVDLNPTMPNSQKTELTLRKTDSSLEKVLVPTSVVSQYIKSLQEGIVVVSQKDLSK